MTNTKPLQLVALISMIMGGLLWGVGMFGIADFLPPPSPDMSVDEIASLYRDNRTAIITGLTMGFVGTGFILLLYCIGSVFMAEAEEGFPYFAMVQALCGLATVLFTALPNLVWMAAAFRVERSPELVATLHDLGWIMWATPSWSVAMQLVCFAICGLRDKRAEPFVPRWICYMALWVAVGELPTPLVPFFTDGPFAWNGLFTFWVAFFSPVIWSTFLVLFVLKQIWFRNSQPDQLRSAA